MAVNIKLGGKVEGAYNEKGVKMSKKGLQRCSINIKKGLGPTKGFTAIVITEFECNIKIILLKKIQ